MTAIRFSLITERETLDLSRETGTLLLCLLAAAWLHLVFFITWEALAGEGASFLRLEPLAPPAPLEITLALEDMEEKPMEPTEDSAYLADEAEETALEAAALDLTAQEIVPTRLMPMGEETNSSHLTTVEPEAPRFKSYNTTVRGAVQAKWLLPPEARANFHPGRLVVNFTIDRDGALLRFVVDESTGSAILDHAGLEALRSAAPFPPFPPELAAFSQLDLTMIFKYQPRYLGQTAGQKKTGEDQP